MDVVDLVGNLGVPVAILVFIGIGVWYLLKRLVGKEGVINALVAGHLKFLSEIKKMIEAQLDQSRQQAVLCESHAIRCEEHVARLDKMSSLLKDQISGVDRLACAAEKLCDTCKNGS